MGDAVDGRRLRERTTSFVVRERSLPVSDGEIIGTENGSTCRAAGAANAEDIVLVSDVA